MGGVRLNQLGPLENDVLKVLWPDKELKTREIYEHLRSKRKVALTSVCVILDRLHERGLVNRRAQTGRGGTRYIYFPASNELEFKHQIVDQTVNSLIEQFGSIAVSYFHDRFNKGAKKK